MNNFCVSMPQGPSVPVEDKWDSEHVRLPCSESSLYPIKKVEGKVTALRKRWKLIEDGLFTHEINTSKKLKDGILLYNSRFKAARNWSFGGLMDLIDNDMGEGERANFFESILPTILQLVKQTKYILNKPIPLCRQQSNKIVTMNQIQCACILANSSLCTWSRRNSYKATSEYANFPLINFNSIFSHESPVCKEKMKCLLNYFDTIAIRQTDGFKFGNLTFERRSVWSFDPDHASGQIKDEEVDNNIAPNWRKSTKNFNKIKVHIYKDVSIHDFQDCLQADFANKFLGGGVIGTGCVQEEILFTVCPELMVGMLFNEVLADNEAIVITGAETFSDYEGYGWDFKFKGRHKTKSLNRDAAGRLQSQVVAIDALDVSSNKNSKKSKSKNKDNNEPEIPPELQQFDDISVERELNKCYSGLFVAKDISENHPYLPGFSTGKWGCGAFGGDPYLKFLIQVLACIETSRDMNFCCFDENFEEMKSKLTKIMQFLSLNNKTVGDVLNLISNYYLDKREGKIDYEFVEYLEDAMLQVDGEDSRESEDNKTNADMSIDESVEELPKDVEPVSLKKGGFMLS